MTTNLNEKAANESWGIRDFELSIVPCAAGCNVCSKVFLTNCNIWQLQSTSWTKLSNLDADGWVADGA